MSLPNSEAATASSSRTIAIGDIHGCSAALSTLLGAIDPGPTDTIVALGDFIDRGDDSRGVIEQLLGLRVRCRLVPILGNHEEMMLAVRSGTLDLASWLSCGGDATLDSYGKSAGVDSIPAEHTAFLEQCGVFHETNRHFFVHANYSPDRPLDRQDGQTLRWLSLWDQVPPAHRSGKTAIVGHTEQRNGKILDLGYLRGIDTFCHGGGWLTALEVGSGQVWQANEKRELKSS